MFETLGNEVTGLHRFQTGELMLGTQEEGTYRMLEETDIAKLFTAALA